jgi:hypothetical protein
LHCGQATARSLCIQSQQLLSQGEILENQVLAGMKGNDDPTHDVTEQDDHGQEYYRNGREEQVSKLLVLMDARGFDEEQDTVMARILSEHPKSSSWSSY